MGRENEGVTSVLAWVFLGQTVSRGIKTQWAYEGKEQVKKPFKWLGLQG